MGPLEAPTPAEVVRRATDAWNAGDLAAAREFWAPDAVYDASERVLNPDVYRGHADLERFLDEVSQQWSSFTVTIERMIELDSERVLTLTTSTGRGRASGVVVEESESASLWTVRDGRVQAAKLFLTRERAFQAAGVPHPTTE